MMLFSVPMDANSLIMLVGIGAGLFVYWRKGGNQASADLIATYKARDELQDKQRKEMSDQIHFLTGEVGRMKGIIEEKEKQIAILQSVDISRNTQLMQFMQKVSQTAQESEVFMSGFKDLPQILSEIKTFMGNINAHMELHKANVVQ